MEIVLIMRSRLPLAAFMAVLICSALGGCGLITDEGRIKIAQIGDEAITRGDLDIHIQQLSIEERYKAKPKEAKLQILQQMIETRLLLKEADRRGIQVTDDEIEAEMKRRGVADASAIPLGDYGPMGGADHDHEQDTQSLHEQIADDLRLAKLRLQAIPRGLTVSDEEVEQYYEANKERLALPERVRIRFVTYPTIEEAQGILDRTSAGEDFAEIVRKVAAETQGKGGREWPPSVYMPLERLGPDELREALKQAKPGEIVGPLRRADGFDLVQLIDRKASGAASLDDARLSIRRLLLFNKTGQAYSQFLARLRDSYQVEIFPDNLPEETPY